MAKASKARRNKHQSTRRTIDQRLPKGHRFDREIADTCSTLLLRAQMKRIEQPVAIERELTKGLRAIVAQKKLSRVAIHFFEEVLSICQSQPFAKAATRLLNSVYNEYVIVDKHMTAFNDISMKERVSQLMRKLADGGWHIALLNNDQYDSMPDDTNRFFCIIKTWPNQTNEDGRLLESLSIGIKTDNIGEFTETAYCEGLLLHKIGSRKDHYHLKIHPDNNVPGISLSPPSIQIHGNNK